jgi:hypothetical protein
VENLFQRSGQLFINQALNYHQIAVFGSFRTKLNTISLMNTSCGVIMRTHVHLAAAKFEQNIS